MIASEIQQWIPLGLLAAVGAYTWLRHTGRLGRPVKSLRRQATRRARELLAQGERWIIIDTETTGISGSDVVVQVAAIDHCGTVLMDTLVALPPRKRISDKAQATHGISREALKDAPTWAQVRTALDKLVADRKCLAYNANFDDRLIEQTDDAHQHNGDDYEWVDVMPIYNAWCGEWDEKRKKLKWQRLPGGDHTAVGDCRATLKILKDMAA